MEWQEVETTIPSDNQKPTQSQNNQLTSFFELYVHPAKLNLQRNFDNQGSEYKADQGRVLRLKSVVFQ